MSLIEKLVSIVSIEVDEPAAFGGFHFICLFSVVIISIWLSLFFSDTDSFTFRSIALFAFSVMLLLEVLKEIALSFHTVDGALVFDYPWGMLPFQLCSTPLYFLPLLSLLPDGRCRDAVAAYTMTYTLIGGIAVYLFPSTVFTSSVAINVQTMIHHGLQIVIGVYTAIYYRRRTDKSLFLGGVCAFTVVYAIANLLNTVGYDLLLDRGAIKTGESFNMFFVSPRPDQQTPVLTHLFKSMPPILLILGYYCLMVLGSFIIIKFTNLVYLKSKERTSNVEKRKTPIIP
jgi:hypothetical protein